MLVLMTNKSLGYTLFR